MQTILLRQARAEDEPFLREMLYQALYVPKDSEPFPRDIVEHPEIKRYVEAWGQPGDAGVIAVNGANQQPIGAAWIRLFGVDNHGYGFIDLDTPELSIAVLPEHRGRGVGTRLLNEILAYALTRYKALSLSVSADNPAIELYRRSGFEAVRLSGSSVTMLKRFDE